MYVTLYGTFVKYLILFQFTIPVIVRTAQRSRAVIAVSTNSHKLIVLLLIRDIRCGRTLRLTKFTSSRSKMRSFTEFLSGPGLPCSKHARASEP